MMKTNLSQIFGLESLFLIAKVSLAILSESQKRSSRRVEHDARRLLISPRVASFVFNKSWRVNWDDINQRWWFHAVRCCQPSRLSLSSGHFCASFAQGVTLLARPSGLAFIPSRRVFFPIRFIHVFRRSIEDIHDQSRFLSTIQQPLLKKISIEEPSRCQNR